MPGNNPFRVLQTSPFGITLNGTLKQNSLKLGFQILSTKLKTQATKSKGELLGKPT